MSTLFDEIILIQSEIMAIISKNIQLQLGG
jgi:hypothetical protein